MPQPRQGRLLFVIILCLSVCAWGQGSGQAARGAPPQQGGAAAQQAGAQQGGAGAQRGQRGGAVGFYDYDADGPGRIDSARQAGGVPSEGHDQRRDPRLRDPGGIPAAAQRDDGGRRGADLLHVLRQRRGRRCRVPSARLLLRRRTGSFGRLAGVRRARPEADEGAVPSGRPSSPPYGWADNPYTLLAAADLVFVNPVGTAWSRPESPARGANFWTTAGDIASLAEFVRALPQLDRPAELAPLPGRRG